MIKINDRFSIERDKYQWILHESYSGRDQDGNEKVHSRKTYHAGLDQIARVILDRSAGDCKTISELRELLKTAQNIVTKDIEELVNG